MTLDDPLIAVDCQSDSLESVTDTPLPFSEPSGRRCATSSGDEMVNCLSIDLRESHRWRCQLDARITSCSWHLVILIHSTLSTSTSLSGSVECRIFSLHLQAGDSADLYDWQVARYQL